jgi:hypothetical protein
MPASGYGPIKPEYFVVHRAQFPDGLAIAKYCVNNAKGYRWHRTVGKDGKGWKHLKWGVKGAHAGCFNTRSVGVEHAGFEGDSPPHAMLVTSAQACAEFCHFIKKEPSRSFITSHWEVNQKYGGCSSHYDGRGWPWDVYMPLVKQAYEGDDMTPEEFRKQLETDPNHKRLQGMMRRHLNQPRPTDSDMALGWDFADNALKPAGPHPHRFTIPEFEGLTGT